MNVLSVATINAANFGEWSNEERINNFARSIVEDLNSPMIIAVQEFGGLEVDDEPVVHAKIANQLIQVLKDQFQQDYRYAEIAPLPESSGGADNINIRCGFLYREALVTLKHLILVGENADVFIGNEVDDLVASRHPLLASFEFNGMGFNVINCHLKSMSTKDQTKKQAKKQRNRQSQYIAEYIQDNNLLEVPLLVMGDMNDTFSSKTLKAFVGLGLESAHQSLQYQIFTYKYHKKPMLLDYILYNEGFEKIECSIAHINTDQNSDRAYSDHDPLMMICRICPK